MASSQVKELYNGLAEIKSPQVDGFDASDSDYLTLNFSATELRKEVVSAEERGKLARIYSTFGEEGREEERYWLTQEAYYIEFARAARSALDVRQWLDLNEKVKTHPGRRLDPKVVKAKVDILALVEHYTKLRKSGRNFTGCCPLHDDRHPSFVVYPERQSWHCFGCNKGGDAISFVMEAEHIDFLGAVSILGNGHG